MLHLGLFRLNTYLKRPQKNVNCRLNNILLLLLSYFPFSVLVFMIAVSLTSNGRHFIIQLMHNIQYVETIKIIKHLQVLQHVSDHRGSIIREPCTVLG